jgi:hypothetical protein
MKSYGCRKNRFCQKKNCRHYGWMMFCWKNHHFWKKSCCYGYPSCCYGCWTKSCVRMKIRCGWQ